MKEFIQKRKEIVALFVYIAIIGLMVYFVVMPLLIKIKETNDGIQEEKLSQEILQKRFDDLSKTRSQYEFLLENEKYIDVLVDRNNAVALIEKLEKIAQVSNNEVAITIKEDASKKTTAKATPAVEQEGFTKEKTNGSTPAPAPVPNKNNKPKTLIERLPDQNYLQAELTVKGNYESIINFISALENFEYYCDIIGVQLGEYKDVGGSRNSGYDPFAVVGSDQNITKVEEIKKYELQAIIKVVFYAKN